MRARFLLCLLLAALLLAGCGLPDQTPADPSPGSLMPLQFADQFSVLRYDDGSALITIGETDRYLLLPENAPLPEHDRDAVVLRQPLNRIYLAASSVLDLFIRLDALDRARFTSLSRDNCSLPEAVEAMDREELLYVGKYSAPDFELLLSDGCDLAVENMMITHSPEIQEKLVNLGIPVLVDLSSYESHPLGRLEWIKLYGLLLGRETEADAFFDEQVRRLDALSPTDSAKKSVVFFYINAAGAPVVRKGGDYAARMIELAGGRYVFEDLRRDETAVSTVTLQMESFYRDACNADVMIYSSAIGGELSSLEELLAKAPLLADFKAVESGEVWCTEQNVYQQSSRCVAFIEDLNEILSDRAAGQNQLRCLHRLTERETT